MKNSAYVIIASASGVAVLLLMLLGVDWHKLKVERLTTTIMETDDLEEQLAAVKELGKDPDFDEHNIYAFAKLLRHADELGGKTNVIGWNLLYGRTKYVEITAKRIADNEEWKNLYKEHIVPVLLKHINNRADCMHLVFGILAYIHTPEAVTPLINMIKDSTVHSDIKSSAIMGGIRYSWSGTENELIEYYLSLYRGGDIEQKQNVVIALGGINSEKTRHILKQLFSNETADNRWYYVEAFIASGMKEMIPEIWKVLKYEREEEDLWATAYLIGRYVVLYTGKAIYFDPENWEQVDAKIEEVKEKYPPEEYESYVPE